MLRSITMFIAMSLFYIWTVLACAVRNFWDVHRRILRGITIFTTKTFWGFHSNVFLSQMFSLQQPGYLNVAGLCNFWGVWWERFCQRGSIAEMMIVIKNLTNRWNVFFKDVKCGILFVVNSCNSDMWHVTQIPVISVTVSWCVCKTSTDKAEKNLHPVPTS